MKYHRVKFLDVPKSRLAILLTHGYIVNHDGHGYYWITEEQGIYLRSLGLKFVIIKPPH